MADGLAVFRLRRRGQAVEAVLCELLAPHGGRELVAQIASATGADYVIAAGRPIAGAHLVRVPRQGPDPHLAARGRRRPPASSGRLAARHGRRRALLSADGGEPSAQL